MFVFIDESGFVFRDPTLQGSVTFAVGMVLFNTSEDTKVTEQRVSNLHVRTGHKAEFRFSKCRDSVRDEFFRGVRSCPFRVRALVARGTAIVQGETRGADALHSYWVRQLMMRNRMILKDAKVRVDGAANRTLRRSLTMYIRRELDAGSVADIKFVDSKKDQLMQLADMCVGAIARAHRHRSSPDRWLTLLLPRIDEIWVLERAPESRSPA